MPMEVNVEDRFKCPDCCQPLFEDLIHRCRQIVQQSHVDSINQHVHDKRIKYHQAGLERQAAMMESVNRAA